MVGTQGPPTGPQASGDPSLEDTQPAIRRSQTGGSADAPQRSRLGRTILIGILVLVVSAFVIGLLVLPPLVETSPGIGPGYDVLALGEVSVALHPGDDALLRTQDGIVTVYVPADAYPDEGVLILKAHPVELLPDVSAEESLRFYPVDVYIADRTGSLLEATAFSQPVLLCYLLTEDLIAAWQADPDSVRLERYETSPVPQWVSLPWGPGWEQSQLCGSLDHLTLFSLAVDPSAFVQGGGAKDFPSAPTVVPPPYLFPGTSDS